MQRSAWLAAEWHSSGNAWSRWNILLQQQQNNHHIWGGALVTNDERLYSAALRSASQARENKPYYEHREVGYSYRMGPLTAIQGLCALRHLSEKINKRRAIYARYYSHLAGLKDIKWAQEPSAVFQIGGLQQFCSAHLILRRVKKRIYGMASKYGPLWNPMHEQPVFQAFRCKKSWSFCRSLKTGLTLPSSDFLSEADLEKVLCHFVSNLVTRAGNLYRRCNNCAIFVGFSNPNSPTLLGSLDCD